MSNKSFAEVIRIGWIVIVVLFVFTAIEFAAAITLHGGLSVICLAGLGIAKAALIVHYFMHFSQLWQHVVNAWDGVIFVRAEEE